MTSSFYSWRNLFLVTLTLGGYALAQDPVLPLPPGPPVDAAAATASELQSIGVGSDRTVIKEADLVRGDLKSPLVAPAIIKNWVVYSKKIMPDTRANTPEQIEQMKLDKKKVENGCHGEDLYLRALANQGIDRAGERLLLKLPCLVNVEVHNDALIVHGKDVNTLTDYLWRIDDVEERVDNPTLWNAALGARGELQWARIGYFVDRLRAQKKQTALKLGFSARQWFALSGNAVYVLTVPSATAGGEAFFDKYNVADFKPVFKLPMLWKRQERELLPIVDFQAMGDGTLIVAFDGTKRSRGSFSLIDSNSAAGGAELKTMEQVGSNSQYPANPAFDRLSLNKFGVWRPGNIVPLDFGFMSFEMREGRQHTWDVPFSFYFSSKSPQKVVTRVPYLSSQDYYLTWLRRWDKGVIAAMVNDTNAESVVSLKYIGPETKTLSGLNFQTIKE